MEWSVLNQNTVEDVLTKLDVDSATASDKLPARVLQKCAAQLAWPVLLLTMCILNSGHWPSIWMLHWMLPLHKKRSVSDTKNYRGIHLTSQLSKVVERLVALLWVPTVSRNLGFGPRQFAYMKGRGSRDATALLVCKWMLAFLRKRRVAVYCSDVSGAFDRVSSSILLLKLRQKGVPIIVVNLLKSWLRRRQAQVVVGGATSSTIELSNM
eukprot:12403869-Karenia_brevis.AAC.1